MKEYKVTVRGNDGYLRGIWYFPAEAEAKHCAAYWMANGWLNVVVEVVE